MLTVENASLHYGAAQALRGVSLEVKPNSITCVLGRNGVGKTSMLRAIVGQHPLSSGSISFDGTPLGKKPPYDRARAGIAFVPQGREIFPCSPYARTWQPALRLQVAAIALCRQKSSNCFRC